MKEMPCCTAVAGPGRNARHQQPTMQRLSDSAHEQHHASAQLSAPATMRMTSQAASRNSVVFSMKPQAATSPASFSLRTGTHSAGAHAKVSETEAAGAAGKGWKGRHTLGASDSLLPVLPSCMQSSPTTRPSICSHPPTCVGVDCLQRCLDDQHVLLRRLAAATRCRRPRRCKVALQHLLQERQHLCQRLCEAGQQQPLGVALRAARMAGWVGTQLRVSTQPTQ